MSNYRFLVYGPAGGGKTTFGVTSFFDPFTRTPREGRKGRLVLFGNEGNEALGLPPEMVKRFPYDYKNPLGFVEDFEDYLKILYGLALKGEGLTDLVLDSISELGSAYLDAYEVEHEALCAKEKWASWRAWRKKYPQIERYLTTDVLHANVVWTAHTREVKETAVSSSGKELKGDSDWLQDMHINNIPSIEGKAKEDAPHGFDFVVYFKPDSARQQTDKGVEQMPVHRSYWLPTKDFLVKNKFEHLWKKKHPTVLENVTFPQVEGMLAELEKEVSK